MGAGALGADPVGGGEIRPVLTPLSREPMLVQAGAGALVILRPSADAMAMCEVLKW